MSNPPRAGDDAASERRERADTVAALPVVLPMVFPRRPAVRRLATSSLFYLHRQRLLDALYEVRPFIRGVVLDVGCFDRPYWQDFGHQATSWIGLDYPSYGRYETQADLYGGGDRLPLRDCGVDTVLCTQVLDDLRDPQHLFDEAARVLRPGGALVLSAAQYSPPHNEPQDFFRLSRFALDLLATRAGLRTVRLVPQGGVVALVGFVLVTRVPFLRGGQGWQRLVSAAFQDAVVRFDRRIAKASDTIGWVLVAEKPAGAAGAAGAAGVSKHSYGIDTGAQMAET